jgi:hypothetical protein
MAIFFPWLAPRTEAGGCSGSGGPPASRPRLRTARGGKEGGRRGELIPTLTLGRGGVRRRLHGRRRTGGGGARGRRRSGAQSRGEGGRGDAWQPGERPASFIGGGRRFGRDFSSSGSFNGGGEGKYPAVDPFRRGCGRDSGWGCSAV